MPLLTSLSITTLLVLSANAVSVRRFFASTRLPFLSTFALRTIDNKSCWDPEELLALEGFIRAHADQLRELTLPGWHLTRGLGMPELRASVNTSLSRAPLRRLSTSLSTACKIATSGSPLIALQDLVVFYVPLVNDVPLRYSTQTLSVWPCAPGLNRLTIRTRGWDKIDWKSLSQAYPNIEYLAVDWARPVSVRSARHFWFA
jgi:hypothetical protein